jgi:hypothetical protein
VDRPPFLVVLETVGRIKLAWLAAAYPALDRQAIRVAELAPARRKKAHDFDAGITPEHLIVELRHDRRRFRRLESCVLVRE